MRETPQMGVFQQPVRLSSGKHDEQVDFVAILNGFEEFIGVRAGMIDIDFNDVKKFILLGK